MEEGKKKRVPKEPYLRLLLAWGSYDLVQVRILVYIRGCYFFIFLFFFLFLFLFLAGAIGSYDIYCYAREA